MYHGGKLTDNSRIPIIPFSDPDLKHLLNRGELFIDYDAKRILIVDKLDRTILHDLTQWVGENIGQIDGDVIEITIEGFGTVKLKEIMVEMLNSIKTSTLVAEEILGTGYYFSNDRVNPKVFNTNRKGELEIRSFSTAGEDTVLVKNGGQVKWIPVKGVTGDGHGGGSSGNNNSGGGSSGGGGIVGGDLNSAYGDVIKVEVTNGVLYPQITNKQLSDSLSGSHAVILPASEYDYIHLEWLIITGKTQLELDFRNTVFFDSSFVTRLEPNTRYRLSCTSFDKALTWHGKYERYHNKI